MGQSMQVTWRGSTISVTVPGGCGQNGPKHAGYMEGQHNQCYSARGVQAKWAKACRLHGGAAQSVLKCQGGAGKMGQSMQVTWRGSTISVTVPGSEAASGPDAIPFLAGCLVHCLIGYVFNKGLYCLLTTTKLPLVGWLKFLNWIEKGYMYCLIRVYIW